MPKDFYFPSRVPQIWTTPRFAPSDFVDRNDNYIYGLGKLKPGVSLETARAEMQTIASQLAREYPKELAHTGATLNSLRDDIGLQTKRTVIEALLGGCRVRIADRFDESGEPAARQSARTRTGTGRANRDQDGARRTDRRQMLTESLVLLSLAGGTLGIALAAAALPLMVKLVPVYLPIAEIPPVATMRFLLFALGSHDTDRHWIRTCTGVARVPRGGGRRSARGSAVRRRTARDAPVRTCFG